VRTLRPAHRNRVLSGHEGPSSVSRPTLRAPWWCLASPVLAACLHSGPRFSTRAVVDGRLMLDVYKVRDYGFADSPSNRSRHAYVLIALFTSLEAYHPIAGTAQVAVDERRNFTLQQASYCYISCKHAHLLTSATCHTCSGLYL
jgi:hypothetical protein